MKYGGLYLSNPEGITANEIAMEFLSRFDILLAFIENRKSQPAFIRGCWGLDEQPVKNNLRQAQYDFLIFDIRGNLLLVQAKRSKSKSETERAKKNPSNGKLMLDYLSKLISIDIELMQTRFVVLWGEGDAVQFQIGSPQTEQNNGTISIHLGDMMQLEDGRIFSEI